MVFLVVKEYIIKDLIEMLLTPEIQRIVDEKHVQSLVDDQIFSLRTYKQVTMLQSIIIGKALWEHEQNYYIIDGQHRIAAFKILGNIYTDIFNQKIQVLEYNLPTKESLEDLFHKISKTLPVHPLLQTSEWVIIKPYIQYLKNNFGTYLSKSSRPHKPNISISKLEDRLYNLHYGERILKSGLDVENLIMITDVFNSFMRQQLSNNKLLEKDYNIISSKGKDNNIAWFGFFRNFEWLDICIETLFEVSPLTSTNIQAYFYSIKLPTDNKRPIISRILRNQVWNKCNSSNMRTGKCYCCNEDIDYDHMECGHIKAFILGGDNNINNLMPVCKICNRDMGVMDLELYKTMIQSQI